MSVYYKCLTKDRTGGYSDFVYPETGVPLPTITEPLEMCKVGYHVCEARDLLKWDRGGPVYVFHGEGAPLIGDNKACFSGGVLGRLAPWTDRKRRHFACDCAERALLREREAGREPDERSWKAVEVARRFADGLATQEELYAAWVAANAAARATANAVAWATAAAVARAAALAAKDAARAAEIKWQAERMGQYLRGEAE